MSATIQPTITFTEIPYNWQVPGAYTEVVEAPSQNALLNFPSNTVIIGQMLAGGTAAPANAYPIFSVPQAVKLFGVGSVLAGMCALFLANNPYTPFSAVGVSDATGAAKAAGGFGIIGTATSAGTLALYIGGYRVPVPVNVGDTGAVIAASAIAAAAQVDSNGVGNGVPYIATPVWTSGTNTLTITALHGGTLGNQISLRVNAERGDVAPAGLLVTVTPMAGGATDPTISPSLTAISGTWWTDCVTAYTDTANMAYLTAWLTSRYGALAKQDCTAYASPSGTYGTLLSQTVNSKFITILPFQNPLTPSWEAAAAFGGACAYSTFNDPALQMKTVPLVGVMAPAVADQFLPVERDNLLLDGSSTYTVDLDGTVLLERVVMTYTTDTNGVTDMNWHDLAVPKVATRVRYDWDGYIEQQYPRAKLADNGTLAAIYNANVVTPDELKASFATRSAVWEKNGWIEDSATTAAAAVFVRDQNDPNRVDARMPIEVIGSLIVLAGQLQVSV
jgi:phage tail sheath gpL-like